MPDDDVVGSPFLEAYGLPTVAHADTNNLNILVERDEVLWEAGMGFGSSQGL